jgi:uncharacterized membrane protein
MRQRGQMPSNHVPARPRGYRYRRHVEKEELRKKRDQELIELLNELRVALPGAQVMFAFLLIAPFSTRFPDGGYEHGLYLVALVATTLATALLIAPSAYHRLRWRQVDKEAMLRISNGLAIAGLTFLAVAMSVSVLLVTTVTVDRTTGIALGVTVAVVLVGAWFVMPLRQPYDRWDDDAPDPAADESVARTSSPADNDT